MFYPKKKKKGQPVEVGAMDRRAFETVFEPQQNNLYQIIKRTKTNTRTQDICGLTHKTMWLHPRGKEREIHCAQQRLQMPPQSPSQLWHFVLSRFTLKKTLQRMHIICLKSPSVRRELTTTRTEKKNSRVKTCL